MKKLGGNLAKKISRSKLRKQAKVIALSGDLGSGKTTFAQGFLRGLGVKGKITSPTFVLVKRYIIPKSPTRILPELIEGRSGRKKKLNPSTSSGNKIPMRLQPQTFNFRHIHHADFYRLAHAAHLKPLEFKKILDDPRNIVLIEWPERVKGAIPKDTIKLLFQHGAKENERMVKTK
jgi:tRNA threonylcarbamoyladenosine biosynthesis protein TsaE